MSVDPTVAPVVTEEKPPAEVETPPVAPDEPSDNGFKPITSQDEFNRLIGKRIGDVESRYKDYDSLKAKAEKFDEAERAKLSDIEQRDAAIEDLKTKLAELQGEVEKRDYEALRTKVATDKGLSPALASRLTGKTQEELEADADSLLELMPKAPLPGATPKSTPTGGGKPATDPDDAAIDSDLVAKLMADGF